MRFVKSPNARHAKFAARMLAHSKNKEESCTEVIQVSADEHVMSGLVTFF